MCQWRRRESLRLAMERDPDDTGSESGDLIRIELRLDGSMPTGRATAADGAARKFTGWVALMSAVDLLAGDNENENKQEG